MTLEETIARAERLLFGLAIELRSVPVHGRTRALHLRALELKRDVALCRRRGRRPSEAECERALGEIEALTREVHSERVMRTEEGRRCGAPDLARRRYVPSLAAVARLAR